MRHAIYFHIFTIKFEHKEIRVVEVGVGNGYLKIPRVLTFRLMFKTNKLVDVLPVEHKQVLEN